MTAPVRFKENDLKRAISGAQRGGMRVGRVEIMPDGRIVLLRDGDYSGPGAVNPWDAELQ
jgi:hypothetical protein